MYQAKVTIKHNGTTYLPGNEIPEELAALLGPREVAEIVMPTQAVVRCRGIVGGTRCMNDAEPGSAFCSDCRL